MRLVLATHPLKERLVGSGMADRIVFEKHQALKINFLDPDLGRDLHERRQFRDGFLNAGKPCGYARAVVAFALLEIAERAYIFQDATEVIFATDCPIRFCVCGIERDPQFVKPRRHQGAAVLLIEHSAIGVEQHIDATVLQVAHHRGKVLHQHRLADTVEHGTFYIGKRVEDFREQLPAHVGGRFKLLVGPRASGTQEIASIGGFKVNADRQTRGRRRSPVPDALEVPALIDNGEGSRVAIRFPQRRCLIEMSHSASLCVNGLATPAESLTLGSSPARRCARSVSRRSTSKSCRTCVARWAVSAGVNETPAYSSDRKRRSAAKSSTSYQDGSTCTARPISAARSSV